MGSFLCPSTRSLGGWAAAVWPESSAHQRVGWAANFNFHPGGLTHWLPNELVHCGAAAAACERLTIGFPNGLVEWLIDCLADWLVA